MVKGGFEKGLLESKKSFFNQVVIDTTKKFKIPIPLVKFWNCPSSKDNELAHCHVNNYLICISEEVLVSSSNEDLYEIATHEVTHLLHGEHNSDFYKTLGELKSLGWEPHSSGIVKINENDLSNSKKFKANYTEDRKKCNYYQGEVHLGFISSCQFCHRFFCDNHIKPYPLLEKKEINNLPYDFKREVDNSLTHPCPEYTLIFITKVKEYKENETKQILKFLDKKPKRELFLTPNLMKKENEEKPNEKKLSRKNSSLPRIKHEIKKLEKINEKTKGSFLDKIKRFFST